MRLEDRIREEALRQNPALRAKFEEQAADPYAGMTAQQRAEAELDQKRLAQDPDSTSFAQNPYARDPTATQEATFGIHQNQALARANLAEQPGAADYTLNQRFYQPMSWDPSQAYQYETADAQERTNAEGLDAQREALGGYRDIVGGGGLTAIDRAAMLQSQMQREQELRANQDAILRNAAEQGRGGGLLSYLSQGQAAAGTANMRALDDARMQAAALGRKEAALAGMGAIGGNIQSAQDAIDKFNTSNRQDVQQRNANQFNSGVDTKYNDERESNNNNVTTGNEFEKLNKGDNYGARGAWKDRQDARANLQNQNTNAASYFTGKQQGIEAQQQQRFNNAITGISAVASPIAGLTKKKFAE